MHISKLTCVFCSLAVSPRKCLDSHSILNPHSGECIRLVTTDNNWTEARQYCLSHGETMATFKTLQSVEWLSKLLRDKKNEGKVMLEFIHDKNVNNMTKPILHIYVADISLITAPQH